MSAAGTQTENDLQGMTDFQLTSLDRVNAAMQHIYPKHALRSLMYRATRIRFKPWKNWQIRWFIKRYNVNMDEALESDPQHYPEFNTFFTRPLRPDARPLPETDTAICSPADGRILQAGPIDHSRMLQVKGHELDVVQLLGGDKHRAEPFTNGSFVTVYLSPRDYHRVHMPIDGTLTAMAYVPGELFSVSLACAHAIPGLFARNERVVCFFDTPAGPVAQILVGAVFVGSIETVWGGAIEGPRRQVTWTNYNEQAGIRLARGAEMGRFNMGSTVITLFGGNRVKLEENLKTNRPIEMGHAIGSF